MSDEQKQKIAAEALKEIAVVLKLRGIDIEILSKDEVSLYLQVFNAGVGFGVDQMRKALNS